MPLKTLELTHEAPVLEGKAPLQRVKGQVAARALGVVVWAGELGAGGLEAAAGDEGWGRGGAEGSTGEHLESSVTAAIEGVSGRTLAVRWSGEVAEFWSRWFDASLPQPSTTVLAIRPVLHGSVMHLF